MCDNAYVPYKKKNYIVANNPTYLENICMLGHDSAVPFERHMFGAQFDRRKARLVENGKSTRKFRPRYAMLNSFLLSESNSVIDEMHT